MVLARYSGKGPQHWRFLFEEFTAAGGTKFGDKMSAYERQYPDRIKVIRQYDLSRGAMVEIIPREKK
jgi:hypothetical protein